MGCFVSTPYNCTFVSQGAFLMDLSVSLMRGAHQWGKPNSDLRAKQEDQEIRYVR